MIRTLLKTAAGRANQSNRQPKKNGLLPSDVDLLLTAEIAEALTVTTYTHLINDAPFFYRLPSDAQGYLIAAREEEMSHYVLEESLTSTASPCQAFYFPAWMFKDAQATLNLLVTLEDLCIATYLLGVRNFSTADLRVTSARILAIEGAHRTLARAIGPDVSQRDGGPIQAITGAEGVAENVAPPNNSAFGRTLKWTDLNQALDALSPFVDPASAAKAGFDKSKQFEFKPFTPSLPSPLGDFTSFGG